MTESSKSDRTVITMESMARAYYEKWGKRPLGFILGPCEFEAFAEFCERKTKIGILTENQTAELNDIPVRLVKPPGIRLEISPKLLPYYLGKKS